MSAPYRILIAALGGEGGGVLAGWVTDAAVSEGFAAQRTSIPGVAQRTGSTTYYIELLASEGRRPVLGLTATPGEVDLVVASELMEAARVVQGGFVTPDRTVVLASSHRVYTVQEKIAMGDGRADVAAMTSLVERFAKLAVVVDFAAIAGKSGCQTNAVLLGAMSYLLPVSEGAFRTAIERDGRAIEANLRGFEAGRELMTGQGEAAHGDAPAETSPSLAVAEDVTLAALPEAVRAVVREGVSRLTDFQDAKHAQTYVDHVRRIAAHPQSDPELVSEFARHLALRMSSEDTIRVAQLKLRNERLTRLAREAKARDGDIVQVTEYLKPGPEEMLSMLPAWFARPVLGFIRRRGWAGLAMPMKVRTTSIVGFLALKMLAGMKGMRPYSLRAAQEREWLEEWLWLVDRSLAIDPAAALQVIETASLVRGYGETWHRGQANWRRVVDEVIVPMIDGPLPREHFADAVLQARLAATADPEGKRLREVVGSLRALAA